MRYLSALRHTAKALLPAKSDLERLKNLGGNLIALFIRIVALIAYPISVPLLAFTLTKEETMGQKQAAATLERALAQQNWIPGQQL